MFDAIRRRHNRFAYSLLRSMTTENRNNKARRLLIYSCPIIATILRRVSTSRFSHAATTWAKSAGRFRYTSGTHFCRSEVFWRCSVSALDCISLRLASPSNALICCDLAEFCSEDAVFCFSAKEGSSPSAATSFWEMQPSDFTRVAFFVSYQAAKYASYSLLMNHLACRSAVHKQHFHIDQLTG